MIVHILQKVWRHLESLIVVCVFPETTPVAIVPLVGWLHVVHDSRLGTLVYPGVPDRQMPVPKDCLD